MQHFFYGLSVKLPETTPNLTYGNDDLPIIFMSRNKKGSQEGLSNSSKKTLIPLGEDCLLPNNSEADIRLFVKYKDKKWLSLRFLKFVYFWSKNERTLSGFFAKLCAEITLISCFFPLNAQLVKALKMIIKFKASSKQKACVIR